MTSSKVFGERFRAPLEHAWDVPEIFDASPEQIKEASYFAMPAASTQRLALTALLQPAPVLSTTGWMPKPG
jgi:hypothetical protein